MWEVKKRQERMRRLMRRRWRSTCCYEVKWKDKLGISRPSHLPCCYRYIIHEERVATLASRFESGVWRAQRGTTMRVTSSAVHIALSSLPVILMARTSRRDTERHYDCCFGVRRPEAHLGGRSSHTTSWSFRTLCRSSYSYSTRWRNKDSSTRRDRK